MIIVRLFLVYILPLGIIFAFGHLGEYLYPDKRPDGLSDGFWIFVTGFVVAGLVCFYFHRRSRKWPDWEWLPFHKW